MQHLVTIACVLSTGVWLFVGLYKLTHRSKMVEVIRAHRIPLPHVAFWLSVSVELVGAGLMMFQQEIWLVILAWLVFLCIATPIFHGAVVRDGMIDYPQLVHVGKNVSIAGGLIALMVVDGTLLRLLGWADQMPRAAFHADLASPATKASPAPSIGEPHR